MYVRLRPLDSFGLVSAQMLFVWDIVLCFFSVTKRLTEIHNVKVKSMFPGKIFWICLILKTQLNFFISKTSANYLYPNLRECISCSCKTELISNKNVQFAYAIHSLKGQSSESHWTPSLCHFLFFGFELHLRQAHLPRLDLPHFAEPAPRPSGSSVLSVCEMVLAGGPLHRRSLNA